MDPIVYLDDQFVPSGEAKISALDLSVLRGYGVMDYLRTYQGEPFYLEEHLVRFNNSAEEIGLTLPKSIEEISEIVMELIQRASLPEASIKVMLTGGVSPDQYLPLDNPTFFAVIYPFVPFPPEYFEQGIKILTECYTRPFPTAKSIQYLPAIIAVKKAEKVGGVDVLFHNEKGILSETGTANFFAVKDGVIITPKSSILIGVTRQIVLELARQRFPVEEREIHIEEISTFDGVFLTSSNKEVMPVSQINSHFFPIPEEIRILMKDFSKLISQKKSLQNI